MRILLTSGGTRTPIDDVRFISNFSAGTFGRHLCVAFLEAGHDVTFLYAKGSKSPHELRVDLRSVGATSLLVDAQDHVMAAKAVEDSVHESMAFMVKHVNSYHPVEYAAFADYAERLQSLLVTGARDGAYDVVVLAAAVSDYAPVAEDGKISSDQDTLDIHCVKTPKLIRLVKQLSPKCFLVGFKLLVDSTQEQLEEAMAEQRYRTHADMVIGNDLRDIKAARHQLTMLSIDGEICILEPAPGIELARQVVENIVTDKETLDGKNKCKGA